ncbi:MAG TPA: hypothetical protein PK470_02080 [Candidatus Omnitrophota bacterium]|nr:hypothetical protein [Candidatus Omnitrophota bacterium]
MRTAAEFMTSPAQDDKNTFRLVHEALLIPMQNIQAQSRVFPEARKHFQDFSSAFIVYLTRQNDAFYSRLVTRCVADRGALAKIAFFREDLKEIKVAFFMFKEKYIAGVPRPLDIRRFPLESARFFDLVRARIKAEEECLLPLMDL